MFILGKNCTGLSPCVEGVWIYNTGLINFYFYCLNFSFKQCWLWEIKPNKNLIFTEYICTIYNECWLRERNQNKDPKWKKCRSEIFQNTHALFTVCWSIQIYECSLWPKSHSCIFPHFHTCMINNILLLLKYSKASIILMPAVSQQHTISHI